MIGCRGPSRPVVCVMGSHEPLTRYVKLRVEHTPGMPGTFSRHQLQRKTQVSDPGMHHGTCVTHVPWCMSGSLTCGVGKRSRHSRSMRKPQFYVSGKRPIFLELFVWNNPIWLFEIGTIGSVMWSGTREHISSRWLHIFRMDIWLQIHHPFWNS